MELMSFAPHVHGSFFLSGRNRADVRINVVLPQSETRKNMCRHVQCMRSRWSDLRIAARRGQTQVRHLRFVVRVDQIMWNARMVRLLGK